MMRVFFLLISLIYLNAGTNITISSDENKLLSWTNKQGVQQKLLINQVQASTETQLIQKTTFPYNFLIDQDCNLIKSSKQAILYEALTTKIYKIQYTYLKENKVINQSSLQFSQNATIVIGDEYLLSFQTFKSSSIIKINQQPNLFLFNNQSLMQIDSKIYSSQSTCYMLSQMTKQLCSQQKCSTIAPENVFQMQFGNLTNFYKVQNRIYLQQNQQKSNSLSQIILSLNQKNKNSNLIQFQYQVKQENISFPKGFKINVTFQMTLINKTVSEANLQKQSIENDKVFEIKISLSNLQTQYTIRYIKLYNGTTQPLINQKVLFNPLKQIKYALLWKNDQNKIPYVEIYDQSMNLEQNETMNNYVDFQTDQVLLQKTSNQDILLQKGYASLQDVTLSQSRQSFLVFILSGSAFGVFLLILILIICCRKRIKSKCISCCFKKQVEAKSTEQSQKKQSGRQLNSFPYEITFQKKITQKDQVASIETQDRTIKSRSEDISQSNPQEKSCPNECSIQQNIRQKHQKQDQAQMQEQFNNLGPIMFKKRQRPFHQQISASTSLNNSQNKTNKKLLKEKVKSKNKEDEETENV